MNTDDIPKQVGNDGVLKISKSTSQQIKNSPPAEDIEDANLFQNVIEHTKSHGVQYPPQAGVGVEIRTKQSC